MKNSIALLANNFDVKWVMSQVGHADSKMTMDVYAQLEQRAKRSHGTNFDRLVRDAHSRLSKQASTPSGDEKAPKRHRSKNGEDFRPGQAAQKSSQNPPEQAKQEMARPGLEPGTPRFSGTRRQAEKSRKSPANRRVAGRARCTAIPVVAGGCPWVKDVAGPPRPFQRLGRGTRCLSCAGQVCILCAWRV